MALEKAFDEISEADIYLLKENSVPEQKTVEYKESLPEESYDSRKEFLADISSFANTSGGHIIFGVKEENGVPTLIQGLSKIDLDQTILTLENLIRDGVQPRISGVAIKAVPIATANSVILVRIPQSWSKPHVVNYRGHWRFYSRNSAGKYPLDVLEVRSAFLASTAVIEGIRRFRFERISKIAANETPITLSSGGKVILHLIPFTAFEPGFSVQVNLLQNEIQSLKPFYSYVGNYRYNLDGIVAYDNRRDENSSGYFQVFRNGIIEIVSESMINTNNGELRIPSLVIEQELIDSLKTCFNVYKKLAVPPPIALALTITGAKNCSLAVNRERLDPFRHHIHKIDRDPLIISEVVAENYSENPASILHPILDSLWNAAGWPKSMGYDQNGEWGKGPNCR